MEKEDIIIKELNLSDIDKSLLNNFNRYQEVQRCWRKEDSKWILKDNPFIEVWNDDKKQQVIKGLYSCTEQGGVVLGAFHDNKLIGFSSIGNTLFGEEGKYIELIMMQVSCDYRNKGLGKKLFLKTADKAKERGAEKLYISAHSSEESQGFYRGIGCIEAQEINMKIAENEPFDIQMEYKLEM